MNKATHSNNPTLAKRANLAKTLEGMPHVKTPKPDHARNPGQYDTEAHTARHHTPSKDGQAFGKVNDTAPMDYTRKTQAEGATNQPVAAIPTNSPGFGSTAHRVGASAPKPAGADGYGHAAHQRSGVLRTSGVKGAHRVGKR